MTQLHLTFELRPSHSPPHRTSTSRSLCVVCGRSMPLTKARVFRVHGPPTGAWDPECHRPRSLPRIRCR